MKIFLYLKIVGLTGLFYALKGKVLNTTALLKIKRQDCKHSFELRIPESDVTLCHEILIDQYYDFEVANEPKVIIDAGANIGLAAIYFANKYPKSKIISIEPEASNYYLLKQNVAPYTNIIPIHAALWHQNKEIDLVNIGQAKWGFITEDKQHSKSHTQDNYHTVQAITIDKIIEQYHLNQIDILKIDIEGAEKEVFSNTVEWIEKVNSIVIELHNDMKSGCNRSFYSGASGFDNEWSQGEHVYLSKGNTITKRTSI